MHKTSTFISNIFVAIAFTIVSLYLIGFLLIENNGFNNDFSLTSCEVLQYEVENTIFPNSPTDIKKEYVLNVGAIKADQVTIAFFTKHQYSKVYVDDVLVNSVFPSDVTKTSKTLGYNWVMFVLSKEDVGKEVRVEIIPVYDNVVDKEIVFLKGTAFSIFYKIFIDSLPQIILGFIAIIVGIVFTAIAFYRKVINKDCYAIFMLGLFSIFLGCWRIFDSEFTPFLISKKPVFIYYIVTSMLTLCPITFLTVLKLYSNDKWKKIYNILCICISVIAMGQILLQVVFNVDLGKYIYIYYCFLITCLIVVLIGELYHRFKGIRRGGSIYENLPMICVLSVIIDLIIYYITVDSSKLFFTIFTFLLYIIIFGVHTLRLYTTRERLLKDEIKQSQIVLSLSQIQPHFIYNTLSSIRYLCKADADLAQQSIDDFSLYLRCNMDSLHKSDLIPFEKELLFVETYVKLEQLRFGDKINVVYDINEKSFEIPPLSIQPLVENAIKHGISVKEEGGNIIIRTERIDKNIVISIIDDGVGFNVNEQHTDGKSHIGLINVENRLTYLMDAEFIVESNSKGTNIKIILKNVK